jgi:hypothetical protein
MASSWARHFPLSSAANYGDGDVECELWKAIGAGQCVKPTVTPNEVNKMSMLRGVAVAGWLIGLLLTMQPTVMSQDSAKADKLAEGEYSVWQNGRLFEGAIQTWTTRRTADGYEIQAKLAISKADAAMGAFGNALTKDMSPEMREEFENASAPTGLDLQLASDYSVTRLQISGKRLSDAKQIQVANCEVADKQISCKTEHGTLRVKTPAKVSLVYLSRCPLVFMPILKQTKIEPGQDSTLRVVVLDEVKHTLQLSERVATLNHVGRETLSIGQYNFSTEKYFLAFDSQSGTRKITLWASDQGIVFALEDSQSQPNVRIVMSQFQKYSDF